MSSIYRIRQFWRAISLKPVPIELQQVRDRLSPAQWALFAQLQPAEQAHTYSMYRKLLEQGEDQPDLLVACLLHDVGKTRYPLNLAERVMVVLMQATLPEFAHRLGKLAVGGWEEVPGWRKAFILAEQHAEWGAEMAHQAGVTPLVETLIRLHHRPAFQGTEHQTSTLLHKLWVVDNES